MVIKPKKAPLVIHVNSHNIRANRKWRTSLSMLKKELLPVITVRYGRGAIAGRCNGLEIFGSSRLVYGDPMGCGAEVWIETDADVMTHASVEDLKETFIGKEGD
tara:strand:- start:133 stop:444 length:312 start_codon:yes stop_codon:yes gene_type:complete